MESLEEKYLKLLAEFEKVKDNNAPAQLEQCINAYRHLNTVRQDMVKSIEDLYSSWFPPKIRSFFVTIKAWCKTGFKKAKYKDRRQAICEACDYYKDNQTCKLCGCYMKAKANIAAAKCPISKWGPEEE
mgnify:CR=1 FL=1